MFRKSKKLIAFLLMTTTMMSMGSSVFAMDTVSQTTVEATGKKLSVNEFNDIYCDLNYSSSSVLPSSNSSEANIEIKSAQVLDGTAELSLDITVNGSIKNVKINGDLYPGYKQQDGRNSIVGDMTTNDDDLKVMLFEIFDDTSNDTLLINPSLNGVPHMKIYFESTENGILLFETALPKELRNASFKTDSKINSFKDIFWFIRIAEPYESKKLPVDEEMTRFMGIEENPLLFINGSTRAVKSWIGKETYYISFYIGPDLYQCWSLANGNMDIPSQISQSDTTWVTSFKVAEHTTVNGTTYRDIDNPYHFRNVRMDVSASDGVTFLRSFIGGTIVDSDGSLKSNGSAIASIIYSLGLDNIPHGGSVGAAFEFISRMKHTNETITLGSNGIELFDQYHPAIGYQMDSYQEIFKNSGTTGGHEIILQPVSKSVESGTGYGVMKTTWDIYYMGNIIDGEYVDSDEAELDTSYSAS